MVKIAIALLLASVLIFALYFKREVNFSMRLWGADVRLETKGDPVANPAPPKGESSAEPNASPAASHP